MLKFLGEKQGFFFTHDGKKAGLAALRLSRWGMLEKNNPRYDWKSRDYPDSKKGSYKSTFIQPSMGSRSFVILIGFSYNICRSMNGLMFKK